MGVFARSSHSLKAFSCLALCALVGCGGGSESGNPPTAGIPEISYFAATPPSITLGASSTLSWTVSGAESLTISPSVGSVTGQTTRQVTPIATGAHTYTLTATNAKGTDTALVLLMVTAAPGGDITPTQHTKAVILSMVAIPENSQTTLAYDYAENIGDGRGITFGIIGFTTGTYDGNEWLHHYTQLNAGNRLAKYIPALDAIDAGPHPGGLSADVTGLDNFISDFHASLNDTHFKQSQLDKMDELYWNPALAKARSLGIQMNITLSELFDACVNHGEGGMADIVADTNAAMGGSPKTGVDEIQWLTKFLDLRFEVLDSDATWQGATDRIGMYRRLLATGNTSLATPFTVTCYGDSFTVTGEGIF